jgi:Na+-exporting ATPase
MQNDAQDLHSRSREGPVLQELSAPAYLLTAEVVIQQLATNPENGLSEEEAQFRITKYGFNELDAGDSVSVTRILMKQIFNAMALVSLFCVPLFPRMGLIEN